MFVTAHKVFSPEDQNGHILRAGDRVHISRLRIGTVVMHADRPAASENSPSYGHIVGFSQNAVKELLIDVKYCDEKDVVSVHPSVLDIYL